MQPTKPCKAKKRHKELHKYFDELLACYLEHNPGKGPSTTTVMELMQWSFEQTKLNELRVSVPSHLEVIE
jgi:hypothetical protein